MKRTFGQIQQDLANVPVVCADVPRDEIEAGLFLENMLRSEAYDVFLAEFPKRFQAVAATSFGDHCVGVCHFYAGHGDQARKFLTRSVERREASADPRLWASYQALGRVLDIEFDDYTGAMEAFRRSMELRPKNPLSTVGKLCAAAKRGDEATFTRVFEEDLGGTAGDWVEDPWIKDRFRRDVELLRAVSFEVWQHISQKLED